MASAFAHSIVDFVVGQYGAESSTPVDHRLTEVGQTIVHQGLHLLLLIPTTPFFGGEGECFAFGYIDPLSPFGLEVGDELGDRCSLACSIIITGVEELDEDPLRPLIVFGVGGAYLARPVKAEANLIQLFAIATDVLRSRYLRVLSCLDSILLSGKPEGIVTHGMEYIEATKSLVAGEDIRGDIA